MCSNASSVSDSSSDEDTGRLSSIDDDNCDNCPSYDSGVSDYSSRSSSISNNNNNNNISAPKSQCRVLEFGEFEDNNGWVQCRSRSYPDRVYYHNTHSGCSTWYRPVSRYIDIPFVSVGRACHMNDVSEPTNDLELMLVSDDEKELRRVATRDDDKLLIDPSDIIARCYTLQMNLIPGKDDSCSSTDTYTSELCEERERADVNDKSDGNDENNNVDDSKLAHSPLCATEFLETEFFVKDGAVDTLGASRLFNTPSKGKAPSVPHFGARHVVYGVPRLKRIGVESQLIKPRRVRVTKTRQDPRKPRKIICEMYGVRTINYDLPEDEVRTAPAGVKSSTLSASDSDSDANVPPSPTQRAKTTRSFESEWHDIEKNLHQPLLSDSSSSPSSRSDTTSSGTSRSTGSTSCSCTSCSSRI